MKRKYVILVVILSLITIGVSLKQMDKSDFIAEDKNYKINELKTGTDIKYEYIIYDNNHNEIDKGTAFRTEPLMSNIDGILQLCISAGTGLTNCRYYNLENGKKSKWFETPILSNNKIVVILNRLTKPTGIIIENIFDDYSFNKKYNINFSKNEVWPLENIKFINDTIEITYVSDNEKIETKIININ